MPSARLPRRRGGALSVLFLALLSLVTATTTAPPATAEAPGRPVVDTDRGQVRGRAHGTYDTFEGIPFAAPPTGPLRWRPPRPSAAGRASGTRARPVRAARSCGPGARQDVRFGGLPLSEPHPVGRAGPGAARHGVAARRRVHPGHGP
ncbi:carboxylesterase family protein [Streptomyces stramineus]